MKRLLLVALIMAPLYNLLLRAISDFITRGIDDATFLESIKMTDAESRLADASTRTTFLRRQSIEQLFDILCADVSPSQSQGEDMTCFETSDE